MAIWKYLVTATLLAMAQVPSADAYAPSILSLVAAKKLAADTAHAAGNACASQLVGSLQLLVQYLVNRPGGLAGLSDHEIKTFNGWITPPVCIPAPKIHVESIGVGDAAKATLSGITKSTCETLSWAIISRWPIGQSPVFALFVNGTRITPSGGDTCKSRTITHWLAPNEVTIVVRQHG